MPPSPGMRAPILRYEIVVKAEVLLRSEDEARFLAAVEEGIASADRGERVPDQQIVAQIVAAMADLFASRKA